MKIGIVSDLHTEYWKVEDFRTLGKKISDNLSEADLVLLAGDIGSAAQAVRAAKYLFPDKPVCMIAGNHEFYGYVIEDVLSDMASAATDNIHFLHRNTFIHGSVRVLGATLWTDYDLFGNSPLSQYKARSFPDFSRINKTESLRFNCEDALAWHQQDKAWILQELDEDFDGSTVVMTHHAPVSFSTHPHFLDDPWNPCFASRLENTFLRDDLDMVVWGHTHFSMDRLIDNTRFVSNQVGTLAQPTGDFGVIIEVG